MKIRLTPRQEKNFWGKVTKTDDCWLWSGNKTDKGYGQFRVGGKMCAAHRTAFAVLVRLPARHLVINHLCKVRNCVNPDHMETVTQYENLMYSDSPATLNKRKTHCGKGHPLSGDNLYTKPGKYGLHRVCIRCKNAYLREWRAEKRRKESLDNVEA